MEAAARDAPGHGGDGRARRRRGPRPGAHRSRCPKRSATLSGLGSTAVTVWNIAKWPVLLVVVVLIVALLYYATPNVRQPKFRWISVGAVVAIVVWIVASALFGFYVANFSSYDKTYGSLAGVIVFLLWLWITNLALLFGAELDAELERARELQSGQPAEEVIQLPATGHPEESTRQTRRTTRTCVALDDSACLAARSRRRDDPRISFWELHRLWAQVPGPTGHGAGRRTSCGSRVRSPRPARGLDQARGQIADLDVLVLRPPAKHAECLFRGESVGDHEATRQRARWLRDAPPTRRPPCWRP